MVFPFLRATIIDHPRLPRRQADILRLPDQDIPIRRRLSLHMALLRNIRTLHKAVLDTLHLRAGIPNPDPMAPHR